MRGADVQLRALFLSGSPDARRRESNIPSVYRNNFIQPAPLRRGNFPPRSWRIKPLHKAANKGIAPRPTPPRSRLQPNRSQKSPLNAFRHLPPEPNSAPPDGSPSTAITAFGTTRLGILLPSPSCRIKTPRAPPEPGLRRRRGVLRMPCDCGNDGCRDGRCADGMGASSALGCRRR
ncbi:hypothetical protein EJ06DRAFT_177950 [Trichodelitschia bisporula]|uniref:Uncharacterized protein n=1 Tax=Trichodelitschia bisporula TaxID=703511 RepID=A0A6G1HMD0_9PEZI|nr:hypothetical protein EJ06DRAFT_177950 [Trichodelitschia bisporula]